MLTRAKGELVISGKFSDCAADKKRLRALLGDASVSGDVASVVVCDTLSEKLCCLVSVLQLLADSSPTLTANISDKGFCLFQVRTCCELLLALSAN